MARPVLIRSRLETEFGAELAALCMAVPGARGAVLSDHDGHPIDHALVPGEISELDLHLAGAQVGGPLAATSRSWRRRLEAADPGAVIEAPAGALLAAVIGTPPGTVLVLVLGQRAHLGRALVRFDDARRRLAELLG